MSDWLRTTVELPQVLAKYNLIIKFFCTGYSLPNNVQAVQVCDATKV